MKNLYVNWLKKDILENFKIIKGGNPIRNGACYKEVFCGPPWYEERSIEEAIAIMEQYQKEGANIWIPFEQEKEVGFLVSTNTVSPDQQPYITYPQEIIRYIEEIGVLKEYRGKNIASELVRRDIINALLMNKKMIAYRTNIMRYFKKDRNESFEITAEKIQFEDKTARKNGQEIDIPVLKEEEKQEFVNQYIELIEKRPDLDVSDSNQLFRTIFNQLEFCKKGDNYTWQKDTTGQNNDRIFPVINLTKQGYIKTRFGPGGSR